MHVEVTGTRNGRTAAVCVKWTNAAKDKEVSLAADDSCGAMTHMERCEIRCYQGAHLAVDVTEDVFGSHGTCYASNANLRKALEWLGD